MIDKTQSWNKRFLAAIAFQVFLLKDLTMRSLHGLVGWLILIHLTAGKTPICNDYQQCMKQMFNHEGDDIVLVKLPYLTLSVILYIAWNNRCNGYESCSEGVILSNHDVSCSGPGSCKSTKIVTDATLKCSGYESCKMGNHEVSGLIYCDSKESCEQAQIVKHFTGTGKEDLVNCNSHSSCHSANIVGHGHGVVCNGQESCWGTVINILDNANESYTDVICNAVAACYTSTVQGINVLCNGYRACYDSTITARFVLSFPYIALTCASNTQK